MAEPLDGSAPPSDRVCVAAGTERNHVGGRVPSGSPANHSQEPYKGHRRDQWNDENQYGLEFGRQRFPIAQKLGHAETQATSGDAVRSLSYIGSIDLPIYRGRILYI